jgi:hypothetical protein
MSVLHRLRVVAYLLLPVFCLLLSSSRADDAKGEKTKPAQKPKEVAGKSEFLRSVPKHYAILKAVDPQRRRVTLLIEGETLPKVWQLTADAELKLAGWWARLDQFTLGDRVWIWFETDRNKQPVAIFMLCDELSEQDMHGPGLKLESRDTKSITVKDAKGKSRTVPVAKAKVMRGAAKEAGTAQEELDRIPADAGVFVQSNADGARLILDTAAFEAQRQLQKNNLRKRWTDEGLPGTVMFLHRLTGEMELMLDHEAIRWARSLKTGDAVTLGGTPAIAAVVREVKPWRERTQVRLVVTAFDQAELALGQRIALKMTPPAAEVDNSPLPPDIDRPRATKEERLDWFLASIYCTCKVGGDGCTGHFYSLASCNPNTCGMPNMMRKLLAEKIDQGMTDRQIYEELIKQRGPDLVKPHLLP